MQKITKIVGANFEGGDGKSFVNPHISPNFGFRELKIYRPLELLSPTFFLNFATLTLKTWRGGTIVEIKNFSCSGGCRFRIKIPVPGLKGT